MDLDELSQFNACIRTTSGYVGAKLHVGPCERNVGGDLVVRTGRGDQLPDRVAHDFWTDGEQVPPELLIRIVECSVQLSVRYRVLIRLARKDPRFMGRFKMRTTGGLPSGRQSYCTLRGVRADKIEDYERAFVDALEELL